jgi:phosphatidylethanolamine/phosphatidyl-N-methylethanolamine N-methyltransferase
MIDLLGMNGLMARSDRSMFLRSWMRHPFRIGAVLPSSRALAELMTANLSSADGPIVELGAGTGVFTRALIRRGIPEHRLALIEANAEFARGLVFRFPQARVLNIDAASINQIDSFFGERQAGAFVSGLPLLSMPLGRVAGIIGTAFRHHLRRGGAFRQFTYLPCCPVPRAILDRHGLKAERIGWVGANLPPATVYRIVRV